ncbi:hypothetical protein Ahy_A10g049297 [Arachis hypogaea]|uniref:Uncharacterized protein n=1 Tax=Arachis hypogaea TaxID=3818 RepID=A0A445B6Z5_ARAHY|nr:hypothetical protein Ahy_A10g049297 [Arachis hypogaea]
MALIGVSEMLGNPIKLSGATRSAPSASSPATFETVALFGKKKAAQPPPSKKAATTVTPANDELAKWYGPDRRIFLPEGLLDQSKIPPYLTGEVPRDKKPEDFAMILAEVENLATNCNETKLKLYCFFLEFELKIYFVFEY